MMNRIKKNLNLFLFAAIFGFGLYANAKIFKNTYITFEIQDDWNCVAKAPDWICRPMDPQKAKEAAIILTAKEKGPTDTFDLYTAHMRSSQTVKRKDGTTLTSTVTSPPQRLLYNNHPWLDGLHLNGELKHYYTRYVATIKDEIAVLITFSAHNKVYAKYSTEFSKTIQSLRIIAPKGVISSSRPGGSESFGTPGGSNLPGGVFEDDDMYNQKGILAGNEKTLGFVILILAILGYIGYRFYAARKS